MSRRDSITSNHSKLSSVVCDNDFMTLSELEHFNELSSLHPLNELRGIFEAPQPSPENRTSIDKLYGLMSRLESRLGLIEGFIINSSQYDASMNLQAIDMFRGQPGISVGEFSQQYPPTKADISIRSLDDICSDQFAIDPYPGAPELKTLAKQLSFKYPRHGNRVLIARIRQWFRKSRDENGQRVFKACENHLWQDGETLEEVIGRVEKNEDGLYDLMKEKCQLDITDEEKKRIFMMEKISAYYDRRIQK